MRCQGACKPGSVSRTVSPRLPCMETVSGMAAIPLGDMLPCRSSNQPGRSGFETTRRASRRIAPIRSCSRWGLPCRLPLPEARCALAAPFHPCLWDGSQVGGLLSVALSLNKGPKPPARRALPATFVSWSPDFPRHACASRGCPAPWRDRGSRVGPQGEGLVLTSRAHQGRGGGRCRAGAAVRTGAPRLRRRHRCRSGEGASGAGRR